MVDDARRIAELEQRLAESERRADELAHRLADDLARQRQAELDRQRVVAELRAVALDAVRSRAQLEAVFDAVSDGIIVADSAGEFVLVNEAEARLLGFPSTVEMKRNLAYFTTVYELRDEHGTLVPVSDWPMARGIRGESIHDLELEAYRRDTGHRARFSFSCEPVRDETGKQILVVVITRDITARRSDEAALRAANEQLRGVDDRRKEFLAVLSHELRNPLAVMKNSLFVARQAQQGSFPAERAHEILDRQLTHLGRLVDDLLDVTRMTRNMVRLKREVLDLGSVVRRTVEDHRAAFERAGVSLDVTIDDARIAVNGDPQRLAQVVGNLLANAAKFTRPGGRTHVSLTVDASGPRKEAVFRVRDTGAGMTAATLDHLFQPFMQADESLDRSQGGLGLGLALTKGLVELHDGSVSATSGGLAKGTEVVVRLPVVDEPGLRAADAPSRRTWSPRRVLVIEDNVDSAEMLREALELGAHEVEVAFDGPQGLTKARAFHPEVVLCDIGLPGMDGYEVARAMRSEPELEDVQLIALSGYALPEDVQRAVQAGFDRHLAKPADLLKLQEVLGNAGR